MTHSTDFREESKDYNGKNSHFAPASFLFFLYKAFFTAYNKEGEFSPNMQTGRPAMQHPWLLILILLLPALTSGFLDILERKTPFHALPKWLRQGITGILFGGIAILSTECGVSIGSAQLNCRDGAVLAAGLFFGGPAGMTAGVIAGIHCWLAAFQGLGEMTQLASTLAVLLTGGYAALLRRFVLEGKRPSWAMSFVTGGVMEAIHMLLILLTHAAQPLKVLDILLDGTFPMILLGGASVMLAGMLLRCLNRSATRPAWETIPLAYLIRNWLLLVMVLAFGIGGHYLYVMEENVSELQTLSSMTLAMEDLEGEARETIHHHLCDVAEDIAIELDTQSIEELTTKYQVAEIECISQEGIITRSSWAMLEGTDLTKYEDGVLFLEQIAMEGSYDKPFGPSPLDEDYYTRAVAITVDEEYIYISVQESTYYQLLEEAMSDMTRYRRIGETGFLLIADRDGKIISAPADQDQLPDRLPEGVDQPHEIGERVQIAGVDYLYAYAEVEGFCFLACLPVSEAYQMMNLALFLVMFLVILMLTAIFILVYLLTQKTVVSRIRQVNQTLDVIIGGQLQQRVDVRSSEEFSALSDGINHTVSALNGYIQEAEKRMEKELKMAAEIQSSALPRVEPPLVGRPEFALAALMDPARQVGGDFYDFYLTDPDHLQLAIGDVSGKSVPAALFMMRTEATLRNLALGGNAPGQAFTLANQALEEGNSTFVFITAWQGSLRLSTGELRYVSAGHELPLIKKADGTAFYLEPENNGCMLAVFPDADYQESALRLEAGDTLLLYTDGVTEAMNPAGEQYSRQRLLRWMTDAPDQDPESLCHALREELATFAGEATQSDDIALVALRYQGPPEKG